MKPTIREEKRKDRDGPTYVVSSTLGGIRRRKAFTKKGDAVQFHKLETERVDSKAGILLDPLSYNELVTAALLRDELCPGVKLPEIVKKFADSYVGNKIITKTAVEDFSTAHNNTSRLKTFAARFGSKPLQSIRHEELQLYLSTFDNPKTRLNHLTSIKGFFRWARDKKGYLPAGPTQADLIDRPIIRRKEHEIYTPEEFYQLLAHSPHEMLAYILLGQLAGIRAAERMRLKWKDWRNGEDNKLVLNESATKNGKRRRVDVCPALTEWFVKLRQKYGREAPIVPTTASNPYKEFAKICKKAGVTPKRNGLRAGYASYHLELHDNAALTAKNDGHSVQELETTYKSISGVTKANAELIFNATPARVMHFAKCNNITPLWNL